MFRRSSSDGATEGKAQGSQGAQTPEAPAKKSKPAAARRARGARRPSAVRPRPTGTGPSPAPLPAAGASPRPPDPRRKLTPEEKTKAREDRSKQLQAMRRGEEWALGPRDRGPAKKLARDYVDAHRRPMEFYMYALILLIIALFAGKSTLGARRTTCRSSSSSIIAVIAVDAYFLRRSIMKAGARAPAERVDARPGVLRHHARRCSCAASARPRPGSSRATSSSPEPSRGSLSKIWIVRHAKAWLAIQDLSVPPPGATVMKSGHRQWQWPLERGRSSDAEAGRRAARCRSSTMPVRAAGRRQIPGCKGGASRRGAQAAGCRVLGRQGAEAERCGRVARAAGQGGGAG